MHRLFYFLAVMAFAALGAEESKEKPNPLLSLDRLYGKPEFSAKSYGVKWLEAGQGYVRLEKSKATKEARDIVRVDPATGKREILVAAKALILEGEKKPLAVSGYTFTKDLAKVLIYTNTRRVWRVHSRGDYWVLDRASGKLQQLGGKEAPEATLMFAKFSPTNSNRVAYVRDKNVYVEDLATGRIEVLTKRSRDTVINGTFDWVYEEELGLRDGFRWSPDGKRIAYWQMDEEGVKEMHMINNVPGNYPQVVTFRYPKVGETNARARVGVVSADGGETTWVRVEGDPRNHYIARMDWADNSKELLLQRLNRLQNRNAVMIADAATGKARTVYTDRDEAWIEVRFGFTDWVEDQFTYVSERAGWRQLYLVSRAGEAKKVTRGNFDIIRMLKLSPY